MKKYLLLSLSLLFLISCGPKKVVESRYENGNPKDVKYYKKVDGKQEVVKEEVFYENKVKKMEGAYEHNQRTGHWSAWYEDGKLWSEGEYKDGKRNGPGFVYHPNGKKYIESNYANDVKVGKWRFFDSTGVVVKEVDFNLVNKKLTDSIK
ncbi:MAG: hypothetical protein HXX13_15495 [Bacteroidetes bacterium]|nr:hypothetical protein [Bacteroidota bacterium]